MAEAYRFGRRTITDGDGPVVLGGLGQSFFSSPFPVFIESSHPEDGVGGSGATQLLITGVDADGRRTTEFLSLKGAERVFTKNTYVFVDKVVVQRGEANKGAITVSRGDGRVVGRIDVGENELAKTEYFVTDESTVLRGYGVSAMMTAKSEPLQVKAVLYRDGRRQVIHESFLAALPAGSYEKAFVAAIPLRPGDLVSLVCRTEGSQLQASGWLEFKNEVS